MACAKQIERASQKAFKDDLDVYTVLIGSQHDADASVKDITVENFSVTARSKELFKNASLKISHGKRYGLVGPNGTGKSSLLKVLAWRKIHVPENIDVLLVDKETVCDDRTVLEAVVSANDELVKLRMRSDVAEAQALKILGGLGFTKAMQTWATRLFNSEWRMRISLARALFVEPALLLLDEPTGYLDLRAVLWLEEYLRLWRNTLVVASHDRDFLNTVCNGIIHPNDFKLHMYDGNFKDFESVYERRHKETDKKIETYDKQVKATKPTDYTVGFHFPEPTEFTPSPLLKFIGVSFIHSEREEFSLPDVDVTIDMGTRVAIVGPNGVGKSTLLNLLAGSLNPTKGEVRRSQMLRIERYSQHFVDHLLTDETPVKYLLRLHPDKEGIGRKEAVRAKLVKFGLPSHNHRTPLNRLSSRQKTRVVFTSISMSKPHILLLDEPTNHLDMQSIDALADALDEFSGGVVLVSHDSRLISRVCDDEEKRQIWVVENGRVEEFDGTFEDYKQKLLKEIRSEVDD